MKSEFQPGRRARPLTDAPETSMKKTLIALALMGAAGLALAQATPVGVWKTIDDDGKTEKSLVRIVEAGGVLSGTADVISSPPTSASTWGYSP